MERAPHAGRVAGLVQALGTPLVQVWGWPGSGRGAVLDALLERLGATARGVAPADLAEPGRWSAVVRRGAEEGARWLVCHALPPGPWGGELVGEWVQELPTGVRLVVATAERLRVPGVDGGLVTPRELALVPDEVASLWNAIAGETLSGERASALAAAADGWFRPLLLAANAASLASGEAPPSGPVAPEDLVALAPVADFLRHEVLPALVEEERAALADPTGADDRVVERLRDTLGLLLADDEGREEAFRPLRLLGALLTREPPGLRARRQIAVEAPPSGRPAASEEPPTAGAIRVRLRLLGRPEAWRLRPDGSWERLHWPLKRAFKALAYLATSSERRAAREDLVEALWPEESDETIRRNFHPTLSHLRRGLRPEPAPEEEPAPLLLEDGVYRLNPELGWWIDAEEVVRLADRAARAAEDGRDLEAIAAWEAAWRLFRGELLEGLYDAWLTDRREDLKRRHLAVLRGLGAAYERQGDLARSTDALRAALVDDPLQERVHVALMRLYAGRGRRDLVRRQYERLSSLLRDELGVEPLPETTDEYHRLMRERG